MNDNSKMPADLNLELLRSITPSMRYDGGDFALWQVQSRAKLGELLGLPFKKCEASFEIEFERETEKYHEIRFSFQSEPGYRVPGHLLVPIGAIGPLPTMICLQGHSTGMYNSLGEERYEGDRTEQLDNDRDFALIALEQGMCAVCIEQRCFGERGGKARSIEDTKTRPDCHSPSMTALLLGRTMIGERVWDISRLIDVLEKHFAQVDGNKIYCMGNSGGGTATFYSACMDTRISACMPSCAVCTYADSIGAQRHCECNYIPGIAKYFDMGDLAGLIAPRPLVIVNGREDNIFPYDGAKKTFEIAKRMYVACGAAENCQWVVGDNGHRFYKALAWPVLSDLTKHGII